MKDLLIIDLYVQVTFVVAERPLTSPKTVVLQETSAPWASTVLRAQGSLSSVQQAASPTPLVSATATSAHLDTTVWMGRLPSAALGGATVPATTPPSSPCVPLALTILTWVSWNFLARSMLASDYAMKRLYMCSSKTML